MGKEGKRIYVYILVGHNDDNIGLMVFKKRKDAMTIKRKLKNRLLVIFKAEIK